MLALLAAVGIDVGRYNGVIDAYVARGIEVYVATFGLVDAADRRLIAIVDPALRCVTALTHGAPLPTTVVLGLSLHLFGRSTLWGGRFIHG